MKPFPFKEGVPGFLFAGALACLKKKTGKDVGLILSEKPCSAAGAFTKNRVKAAPVIICKKRLYTGTAQAILANSGNANACTGEQGIRDAKETCAKLATEAGIKDSLVLPASTGVIGVPLPADKIIQSVPALLRKTARNSIGDFAAAIMTTDTFPKIVALKDTVDGQTVKVCGIAKGAGMIMPDMATMLAFIVTDAAVEKKLLARLVKQHVKTTFNRISVDGDMSTNDSVIVLASGASTKRIASTSANAYKIFSNLLREVMKRLSLMIVQDGEGATKLITITVVNARTTSDAKKAALTVANSCLVKTAFFGEDYNWGRIMAAVGRSGALFDMNTLDMFFNGIAGVRNGQGVKKNVQKLQRVLTKDTIEIVIDVKQGRKSYDITTCDLSYEYVKINAAYTT